MFKGLSNAPVKKTHEIWSGLYKDLTLNSEGPAMANDFNLA